MKATHLSDGYYYVERASIASQEGEFHIHDSQKIFDLLIEKKGNQICYMGTDYFDNAEDMFGIFYELNYEDIKRKMTKIA